MSSVFESLKEKKHAKSQWSRILKDALDADSWGQSIEATEEYEKLYRMLEIQIPELQLTSDEKNTCMKIAHAVSLRMKTLQGVEAAINGASSSSSAMQKLTLDEIRALQPVLQDLFDRPATSSFPIALKNYTAVLEKKDTARGGEVFIANDDRLEKEEGEAGTLLPPRQKNKAHNEMGDSWLETLVLLCRCHDTERASLFTFLSFDPAQVKSGQTTITLTIDKIGLKDAQSYINSFIAVSLALDNGSIFESQKTPISTSLKPNYVSFGHTVHLQMTFEEIQARSE